METTNKSKKTSIIISVLLLLICVGLLMYGYDLKRSGLIRMESSYYPEVAQGGAMDYEKSSIYINIGYVILPFSIWFLYSAFKSKK